MMLPSQPRLIGIAGKAGSGKDTAGDYLQSSGAYSKLAFADPIRRGVSAIFDLHRTQMEHPEKEHGLPEIGRSPRQLMQTLGTEWGRNLVHPDLWIILARAAIHADWVRHMNVVVTDVRFENEADMVRKMGGVIWHIHRSGAGTPHAHISENGVQFHTGCDIVISNNGSLQDLHNVIDKTLT